MSRFSSLKYQPAETRRVLRGRFKRYLPSGDVTAKPPEKRCTLDDEAFLNLLLNLKITFKSEFSKARAFYNTHRPGNSSEPRLHELIDAGWFQVVWGRIWTPHDVANTAYTAYSDTMPTFIALLQTRFGQNYRVTDSSNNDPKLATVLSKIKRKTLTPQDIGCQTPAWVAARLWDRTLPHPEGTTTALREWVDRWEELHCPTVQPGRAWTEAAASTFFDAVFAVLESDRGLVGWDELRSTFVKQMSLLTRQTQSSVEAYIPFVPPTLVDRSLWLDDSSITHLAMDLLQGHEVFSGLVRLLLEEVGSEDHAPAPHKVAQRLMAITTDRPSLFQITLRHIRGNPVLLADLLLYPSTSALAVLLVAQWQSSAGAWDREMIDRDDHASRAIAFTDATSVMGWFLQQGTLDPEEAACLLRWLHGHARGGDVAEKANRESMLATLLGMLAGQSKDVLRAMATMLTESADDLRFGMSTFAVALDVIEVGNLASDFQPAGLVDLYIQFMTRGDHILSADGLSNSAAATLAGLAMRTSTDRVQTFFHPIRIKDRLAAAENSFGEERAIALSIRVHIRVLSRAVAGWPDMVPEALVQALVDAVRSGALKHAEKGRVAAFSPSLETNALTGPFDRPIAADLGAALAALDENERERLLAAVLETDEPLILANLFLIAPHTTRERIRHRIAELTPPEAGDIYSLTEAQARIEALLSADLADAASQFIDAERELQTWGQGPDPARELARLRTTLRLNLLRGQWREIASAEPPSQLTGHHRQVANDAIDFYRGIAALRDPDGDRKAAEELFARLSGRHPHVAAYVQNLFAVRITLLVDGDFGVLRGAALNHGRRLLLEAEEQILQTRDVEPTVLENFNCNKALLLLAIGRPEDANELLASQQPETATSTAVACRSVALARLDRAREAMAILDHADRTLGRADVLRAAREHITSGKPFVADANISSTDDAVSRTKIALFNFKQMDPSQQAEVLLSQPGPFNLLVTDHVREAAASVTALVPMLKTLVIDSSEDDLSSVIRELLTPGLQFLGWSVSDQSKGGHTAKENPGERDLILKKGTTTLAVIEAVVLQTSISTTKLTQHFQKLFAYSECNLFFLLTYAYVKHPGRIRDRLRKIAKTAAPDGFAFCEFEEIPSTDSRPPGFTAVYQTEYGSAKVVFLILDLEQYAQKNAAKAAVSQTHLSGC